MGLLDMLRKDKSDVKATRSALEEAEAGQDKTAIGRVIENILDTGIDGRGPFESAAKVADKARSSSDDAEQAVNKVIRQHLVGGAGGGFLTSLGGFFTMPVAIPVNVLEFYIQGTRMVAAVARLRGYDLDDPKIRTAVLLTQVGSDADEVLRKAGVVVGGGTLAHLAMDRLPKAALMMVNKAVGFRVLRTVGEKSLTRFGRAIPLAGGVVGAGVDGYLMKKIADAAKREFPAID